MIQQMGRQPRVAKGPHAVVNDARVPEPRRHLPLDRPARRWIRRPPLDRPARRWTHPRWCLHGGVGKEGACHELARLGWAFVVLAPGTATVAALARGVPPSWIENISGAEAWALLKAAEGRSQGRQIGCVAAKPCTRELRGPPTADVCTPEGFGCYDLTSTTLA